MEIVKYPHPALRRVAKPVSDVNDDIRQIVSDMFRLMYEAKGIGLAANQVALPIQLFIVNVKSDPVEGRELVFINPKIVERRGIEEGEEGCLSFPGLYAAVKRAKTIRIQALDKDGNEFEFHAEDMLARAIQHEFDHLQGIVFSDKANPLTKLKIVARIKEFEREYRNGQQSGAIRSNNDIERELTALESTYCAAK